MERRRRTLENTSLRPFQELLESSWALIPHSKKDSYLLSRHRYRNYLVSLIPYSPFLRSSRPI